MKQQQAEPLTSTAATPPATRGGYWFYRKTGHARNAQEAQGWERTKVCDTLNCFEYHSDARTPVVVIYDARGNGEGGYHPRSPGITRTGSRTTRR